MEQAAVFSKWKAALLLLPVVIYSCLIHRNDWSGYPEGIHAWAQADQVALMDGFRENGYDILHPQTYLYNHQFPNDWKTADETRITAVDFPWYQWVVAAITGIFHADPATAPRLIAFLFSLLGLVFLFRTVLHRTKSLLWAFLASCFFASLPLFSYYQVRFLPSVPALSLFLCGLYYYLEFRAKSSTRSIVVAVVFLTLAALLRTTYLIPLLAVFGIELLTLLRDKPLIKRKILIAFFSLATIVAATAWNMHLRNKYGSLFLNEILPAGSVSHLFEIVNDMRVRWVTDYFTIGHYVFLPLLMVALFKTKSWRKEHAPLFGLFCLLIVGSLVFFFAMARQFPNHDYYFMDAFYPLVAVTLVWVNPLALFRSGIVRATIVTGFAVTFLVLNFFRQQDRRKDVLLDIHHQTNEAFRGSDEFLTTHGIDKAAKILVLPCHAPNLPFLQAKRAGFAGVHTDSASVKKYLDFPADVVVIENDAFFREVVTAYPGVFRKLKPVAGNGRITICKRLADDSGDEYSFLGQLLTNSLGEYDLQTNSRPFENTLNGVTATSTEEFGAGITLSGPTLPQEAKYLKIEVSMRHWSNQVIVVSVTDKGQTLLYTTVPADRTNLVISGLPAERSGSAVAKVYIFNPDKRAFYVKDLKVGVY